MKTLYWVSCIAMIIVSVLMVVSQQPMADPVVETYEVPEIDPIVIHLPEHDPNTNVYSEKVPLTPGWQAYTQDTCRRYGIDYALMLGLMETESSFQFDADSGWAYGICQIGYINEDWLAEEGIDIHTKQGNIEASCVILSDLLSRYDVSRSLMAYNMGEFGAMDFWDQGIMESQYSKDVMSASERWEEVINATS